MQCSIVYGTIVGVPICYTFLARNVYLGMLVTLMHYRTNYTAFKSRNMVMKSIFSDNVFLLIC